MGFAPWGVLGGGMFKTDEEIKKLQESGIENIKKRWNKNFAIKKTNFKKEKRLTCP
jgi:hypothetical protein